MNRLLQGSGSELYEYASWQIMYCRFEQLALEYDSDEIGELDQYEGHSSLQGTATTDRFSKIMDQFLEVHNTQDHNHDSGHAYRSAAQTSRSPNDAGSQHSHLQTVNPQNVAADPPAGSKQLSSSAATEAEKTAAAAALARVCCSSLEGFKVAS